MIKEAKKTLTKWNNITAERVKLQHVYIFLFVAGVLISGVVALFWLDVGRLIAKIAVGFLLIALVNWVVWSLAKSTVFDKFTAPTQATPRRKR